MLPNCPERRKHGIESHVQDMERGETYDIEGYYCLIISILMGVDASEARKIYRNGAGHPDSKKILNKRRTVLDKEQSKGKEQKNEMRQMRADGYSLETIAEVFGCDDSTVKRTIQKMEEKNDDL